jgi:hypothetical protein
MHIFVEVTYSGLLIPITQATGGLIEAIATATSATAEGWGPTRRFLPKEGRLTLEMAPDQAIGERPGVEVTLLADKALLESRWYKEYEAHQATTKELKEVKAALAKVQAAATAATPAA